jgi:type I restriction enzyme S subunit
VSEATYREWTARAEPRADDVIFTREAPVGQVGLVASEDARICLGQRTVLIRSMGKLPGAFLWATLQSASYKDYLKSRSIGQTVQRVNVKLIKALPLPVADAEQIERIVQVARTYSNVLLELEETIESLKTVRSEILTALLSGSHTIPETYDQLMGA